MRHLLNTLFVTSENLYLTLDGENIVAKNEQQVAARFPLHTLSGIICFTYPGASPALMGACAARGIALSFCKPNGRFLARINGENNGNVLLRRKQYRIADDLEQSCLVARNMIFGKLHNARWSVERTIRDHSLRVDCEKLSQTSAVLKNLMSLALKETVLDSLRGIEGVAGSAYFDCFEDRILNDKDFFYFNDRNRRPPMDPVNALLSYAYSMLSYEYCSALESVGLDAYVGFLHRDRPGRSSLALDMMEELRPCFADRLVLAMINNRMFKRNDFSREGNGSVRMSDEGRKTFLTFWQEKKKETLIHPFLHEKVPWGLVPYVQSLLLARFIRGDIDGYPAFVWK